MIATTVKFKGYRCFKNEWVGFDEIKPINILIGRNNTGKTHLLDLVEALCLSPIYEAPRKLKCQFQCEGVLEVKDLILGFPQGATGGPLGNGSHWLNHGRFFVGVKIIWTLSENGQVLDIKLPSSIDITGGLGVHVGNERKQILMRMVHPATHALSNHIFRRLLAERNILTETGYTNLMLGQDGNGATNIICRYILSTLHPRELIQIELRDALNEIFGNDGLFTEIQPKQNDAIGQQGVAQGPWEVYLGEENKGLIPLSRSGSGLKTVILVLLNLLVIPKLEGKAKKDYVFAFEELENYLHPALLRRLFKYLEKYAIKEKATIFLTTHSSVALDYFGMSNDAQIIHVSHDKVSAIAKVVSAHFDRLEIISELGAKPSDLLQANGIIWVEGPSDRIYLNKWIELFSNGKWREGRDYQCAFYGGALLARTQFVPPEDAEKQLVNLFHVNPNIVVVCDSDRTAASGEGSEIKPRVQRIHAEVQRIPKAHIWITQAKEIENYLPGSVLSKIFNIQDLPDPGKYQQIFPLGNATTQGDSFFETSLDRKGMDKMDLASQAVARMTTEDKEVLAQRFDLAEEIGKIIEKIESWNS
jgi:putative ATP-dependent endonuclease of the OLD family